MTEQCNLSSDCTWGLHEPSDHPCGNKHTPGIPCRFCGKATPLDGSPCPDCWIPMPENMADAKALLALGDLSLDRRSAQ